MHTLSYIYRRTYEKVHVYIINPWLAGGVDPIHWQKTSTPGETVRCVVPVPVCPKRCLSLISQTLLPSRAGPQPWTTLTRAGPHIFGWYAFSSTAEEARRGPLYRSDVFADQTPLRIGRLYRSDAFTNQTPVQIGRFCKLDAFTNQTNQTTSSNVKQPKYI